MSTGSLIKSQVRSANKSAAAKTQLTSISLVIPAYNDEHTIGRLLNDANRLLPSVCESYEIVVCNDGSSDGTLDVIKAKTKEIPNIHLINHPTNKGFGATIRELYLAGRNDYIFSLPGDYQYAPKELLSMMRGLEDNDFIIGWRAKRNDPPRRRAQSIVYNLMLRMFYGFVSKDVNSIKLFKREILDHIELKSSSPFVDAELCIRAAKAGYKIIDMPIEHLPRVTAGASGGKLSVITETFGDLIRMRNSF